MTGALKTARAGSLILEEAALTRSPKLFPTQEQMRQETEEFLRNLPRSPCVDQTLAEIEAYYRHAKPGDRAAVRQTQYHALQYTIVEIEGVNSSRGRVYVAQFGAFYMKSGKNCFHPKGQTTLVVPTEAVVAWALEYPRGASGFTIYKDLSR